MCKLSYSRGVDLPLLDRTTGQQLEVVANRFPDQPAVISRHQNQRLTWAELLSAADNLAQGLIELGVRPHDRVGVWAMSCWEWIVVHFACARAGATLVSVNPAYRSHELFFVLRKSRMKVIFLRDRDERVSYVEILAQRLPDIPLEHAVYFGSAL
jgi:fatty-acyl-CoA synthase